MPDITIHVDAGHRPDGPGDASAALRRLIEGNARFVRWGVEPQELTMHPSELGIGDAAQSPFAAILSCSDARVPPELVFQQALNELFVVRVAGNVPGSECLGSLEYASQFLTDTLRLVLVLGHTGCGAVEAAVDVYLDPARYPAVATSKPLRAVIDKILGPVRTTADALEQIHGAYVRERPGYRQALVDTTVAVNAALTALTLRSELEPLRVAWGVFDLGNRSVEIVDAPTHAEAFGNLVAHLADRERIRTLLRG